MALLEILKSHSGHREYVWTCSLAAGTKKRYFNRYLGAPMTQQTRRSYTDDFKAQAVTLAESIGRGEAARQLDISVKTLGMNRPGFFRHLARLQTPSVAEQHHRLLTQFLTLGVGAQHYPLGDTAASCFLEKNSYQGKSGA